MRYLALVALLAIGCGGIEETGQSRGNPDAVDYGNCPDIAQPNLGGYACDSSNEGNGSSWICGVVDTTKPATAFTKRDSGCVAYAADLITKRVCVAACP